MRTVRLNLAMMAIVVSVGCAKQPQRDVSAKVIDISPPVSRWHADQVVVTVRGENGIVGMKLVPIAQLRCRVGDDVRASVRGVALSIDDKACGK
jgi:hypothetical protein